VSSTRVHHGEYQVLQQVSSVDLTYDTMNCGPQKEDDLGVECAL
jgi:hypothetical protein